MYYKIKLLKKAQKEYYTFSRVTWGGFNPDTGSVQNGKSYSRKKDKQEMRRADLRSGDGFGVSSFFMKKAILGLKTKF